MLVSLCAEIIKPVLEGDKMISRKVVYLLSHLTAGVALFRFNVSSGRLSSSCEEALDACYDRPCTSFFVKAPHLL